MVSAVRQDYPVGNTGTCYPTQCLRSRAQSSIVNTTKHSCYGSKVNMVLYVQQKPQGLLGTGRRGEVGMEVGGEGDYIPIATLSPPE